MRHAVRQWIEQEADSIEGPILEVGSRVAPKHEHHGNLRPLFPGRTFVGLDMIDGRGVDLVRDFTKRLSPPLEENQYSTVLCLDTFEHVDHIFKAAKNLYLITKPGGRLLFCVPFWHPVHDHPHDYWRFTEEAVKYLLRDFEEIKVWALPPAPDIRPKIIYADARKAGELEGVEEWEKPVKKESENESEEK